MKKEYVIVEIQDSSVPLNQHSDMCCKFCQLYFNEGKCYSSYYQNGKACKVVSPENNSRLTYKLNNKITLKIKRL